MAEMFFVMYLAWAVVAVVGMWKAFAKAGAPGWGCLVPVYNVYLMTKMAERPAWWFVLLFAPILNLFVFVVISVDIARRFDRSPEFGAGLTFLGFIFWPVLGFGASEWRRPPVGY